MIWYMERQIFLILLLICGHIKYRDEDLSSYLIFSFFTYDQCLLFWRDIIQEKGLWSTPRRQLH